MLEQAASAETLKPGTLSVFDVLHDDWCQIFNGADCNCDPDVRLKKPS